MMTRTQIALDPELLKRARTLLSRLRRTARAIRGDLERAEGAEAMKRKGELLSTHAQSVPKGAESVTLTDPLSGEAVEIPLEPDVSASENAQRYFRRYKKLKRLLGYGPKRFKAIEAEGSRVEALEAALKEAPDLGALEVLASEASFERLEKKGGREGSRQEAPTTPKAAGPKAKGRKEGEKKPKGTKGRKTASRAYRVHLLKEGWEILVGKDSRGNDQLLREVARPEDLWLHAEGLPGSHVLLRRKGAKGEIPLPFLEAAASLAAHHSKAKGSTKVPVVYTLVKHVRRVKAGRSGQMTYTGEKTLIVPPKPLAKEGEEKA
jgi:predicted ribosome quality control (RQC) complex YloA/Tae2 family protein